MPIYCYECRCGHQFEQSRPMADSGKPMRCPKCKRNAHRDIGAENGRSRTPKDACWPFCSESLGCHPDQVSEYQIELKKNGLPGRVHKDGTLELGSRDEYMKVAKAYQVDQTPSGRLSPRPRRRVHVSR